MRNTALVAKRDGLAFDSSSSTDTDQREGHVFETAADLEWD